MKTNKSGISLIVLVITIIVMIILAGSVIISLSNSGIIGKANEAVDANNLKQVEQLAALAWSEAYIDKINDPTVNLKARVEEALTKNKVSLDKYAVSVNDNGVEVLEAKLGSLIKSPADYGKTVDYTVTVDGTTYNDWQVYYEDEKNGYVYIVTRNSIPYSDYTTDSTSILSSEELALYEKFQVGEQEKVDIIELDEYSSYGIVGLIREGNKYLNKSAYRDYLVGALGTPTIELFIAGWNSKEYSPKLGIVANNYGYSLVGDATGATLMDDGFYTTCSYDLLSTDGGHLWIVEAYHDPENHYHAIHSTIGQVNAIRPVVCLKTNTPAKFGTAIDFSLVVE